MAGACDASVYDAGVMYGRVMRCNFMRTFAFFFCSYHGIVVPLQPKNENAMYRDSAVYVADIEAMTGKSYRTCQRILKKIREHYHMTARQKPTMEQVKQYLIQIQVVKIG